MSDTPSLVKLPDGSIKDATHVTMQDGVISWVQDNLRVRAEYWHVNQLQLEGYVMLIPTYTQRIKRERV